MLSETRVQFAAHFEKKYEDPTVGFMKDVNVIIGIKQATTSASSEDALALAMSGARL